jgi:hypothetical protein
MSEPQGAFYEDLEKNLQNPEFADLFALESRRIQAIDDLINQLDELRTGQGRSKVDLARSLNLEPANVRRFFTRKNSNPTMKTFVDVAMSLGYGLRLVQLPGDDKSKRL